ncbi:MAG: Crp/Fnr family transcriptional regulator [Chthoniobacterales bacterium]
MNILSEEQAAARQLVLPRDGLVEGLTPEFIAELQSAGAFVEYNQQIIVPAGEFIEFLSCIVAGRVKISRLDADYRKAQVGTLAAGQWFGETSLFLRTRSSAEFFADKEVVIWTIPPDQLRDMFFRKPRAVQLLYNIGTLLARRVTARNQERNATAL